jgi:hypothetical protein
MSTQSAASPSLQRFGASGVWGVFPDAMALAEVPGDSVSCNGEQPGAEKRRKISKLSATGSSNNPAIQSGRRHAPGFTPLLSSECS